MHPRLTPANGRVAHVSLRGRVTAARFTEGEERRVARPLVDLLRAPGGALDCQLLMGTAFRVLEEDAETGLAFGQSLRDGYVGYLPTDALAAPAAPTHRVSALASHAYPAPDIKTRPLFPLSFGCEVAVTGEDGAFLRLADGGHVPRPHLAPLARPEPDFVATCEKFLGIPYLWGGNSSAGMDCSGMLQLALRAGGRDFPRDSDMQQGEGAEIPPDAPLARGDLIFWRGHVGVMRDHETLIHANAHHMAVASEPLETARERIARTGGGKITARRRLKAGSR